MIVSLKRSPWGERAKGAEQNITSHDITPTRRAVSPSPGWPTFCCVCMQRRRWASGCSRPRCVCAPHSTTVGPVFVLFTVHCHPTTFLESAVGRLPGVGGGGVLSGSAWIGDPSSGIPLAGLISPPLLQAQALVQYLEEPLTQVAAS